MLATNIRYGNIKHVDSIEYELHLCANGKEGQDGYREVGIEEESTFDQSLHILTFYWH